MAISASPAMRFRALDSWRGLCAILVAAHHLDAPGLLYWQPLVRNAWLFVDFFFVLSGFVIAHAYGDRLAKGPEIKAFVIRRFGRLWPLHVATLAALVLLELSRLVISQHVAITSERASFIDGRSPIAILTNLALVQSLGLHHDLTWNGPSWSISTEFWTYLVFAAVCFAAPARWTRNGLSLLLALAGVFVLVRFSVEGMHETVVWGFARCVYGFFFGTLSYALWRRGIAVGGTVAELGALVLVVAFVSFAPGHGLFEYLTTPVFCFAVLAFAGEKGSISRLLATRPFAALGRWSYSLYMVHTVVIALLFSAARIAEHVLHVHLLLHLPSGQSVFDLGAANSLMYGVHLGATVALSALTWRFVEQPGQRLFGRFAATRGSRPAPGTA